MVAIGGDGTLSMAKEFWCLRDLRRAYIVGVPKTIDFDLSGTEATFDSRPLFRWLATLWTDCGPPPTVMTGCSSWN